MTLVSFSLLPQHARMAAAATLLILPLATACGSSSEVVTTAPSQTRCAVTVRADASAFTPAGGTGTIQVTANRDCTWTAQSDAPWLALAAPARGQGAGAVQYTVASNAEPAPRTAAIAVADQQIQVAQQGTPCAFRLSSTREDVEPAGGQRTIAVTAGSDQCRWSAASESSWIAIVAGGEGAGRGEVTFTVAPASGGPRQGTLRIAGQAVEVAQGTACAGITLGTSSISVGAAGGSQAVTVNAPPACAWSADSPAPWIRVAPSAGTGSGVVTVTIDPGGDGTRTAAVTIAGRTLAINQSPGCAYTVTPATFTSSPAGGMTTLQVRAGAGCVWTASGAADWVKLTAGAGGTGNGDIRITVDPSSGPARSTTLQIADQRVTILQESGCAFTVQPDALTAPASGLQSTLQVSGGATCPWTATSGAPWITLGDTGGRTGPGEVRVSVAGNTGPAREAVVTLAGRTVRVAQASGCSYDVTPSSAEVSGEGGGGTLSVATATGCPWTGAPGADWLTLAPGAGTGAGQVVFTASPNLAPARSATITLAGRAVVVTQASQCRWVFAPPSHTFDASGGNGNVLVIPSGPCAWTASSNNDWIQMTAGTSGTGNGLVQFVVGPHTGSGRSGSITIAGQRYEVVQRGQ